MSSVKEYDEGLSTEKRMQKTKDLGFGQYVETVDHERLVIRFSPERRCRTERIMTPSTVSRRGAKEMCDSSPSQQRSEKRAGDPVGIEDIVHEVLKRSDKPLD